jgi:hypothetical protein
MKAAPWARYELNFRCFQREQQILGFLPGYAEYEANTFGFEAADDEL